MTSFTTIGLMSGTSMDGVDLAHCRFTFSDNKWSFELINCKTYDYDDISQSRLNKSKELGVGELLELDKSLGKKFAELVNLFIQEFEIKKEDVDAICSHGHTIFHQPQKGFTYQIGCGDTIAYHTGIKVINDLRTKDIVAGGQGAPLVPIGDKLLFPGYDSFINIGGFTNVSFTRDKVIAYDICPGNLPINHFANMIGEPFDFNGNIAANGNVIDQLLSDLNGLQYYRENHPKSLGTEWLDDYFYPVILTDYPTADIIRTLSEHIAYQLADNLNKNESNKTLLTGGGAKNQFLVELIRKHTKGEIVIPDDTIIDFKEALIFAFLGTLFLHDDINILSSVTGAERSVTGGVLHKP